MEVTGKTPLLPGIMSFHVRKAIYGKSGDLIVSIDMSLKVVE